MIDVVRLFHRPHPQLRIHHPSRGFPKSDEVEPHVRILKKYDQHII